MRLWIVAVGIGFAALLHKTSVELSMAGQKGLRCLHAWAEGSSQRSWFPGGHIDLEKLFGQVFREDHAPRTLWQEVSQVYACVGGLA